jgi:sporulation protein YlmC with PRC-barrel domain
MTHVNHKLYGATRQLTAAIALTATALGALAQASAPMASAPMASAPMASAGMSNEHRMRVSQMIGSKVLGAADKKVGDIKDLIVDITSGKVRYALLEFDPGFFKADKLFAVPITALGMDATGKSLTYRDVSREQLMQASVDKKDWARAVDNSRYLAGLDTNYGFKPPAGTVHSMRASKVIGHGVDNRSGKDIGKVKDLVVDMGAGMVKYAVLSFDPSWFSSAKLFAFPVTAFKVRDGNDDLILDVDKAMLTSMKNFDSDKWGSLNDLNRDAFINPPPSTTASK